MTGMFDLYYLLVEVLCGSVGIALLVVAAAIFVIGSFGKMSYAGILSILIFFGIVSAIHYSVITHFLMLIFILFYFTSSLIRFIQSGGGYG
jgi:hypothetical protein